MLGASVSHQKAGCGSARQAGAPFPAARSCCGHSFVLPTPESSACRAWSLELLPRCTRGSEAFVPRVSELVYCTCRGSTVGISFQNNGSSAPTLDGILWVKGRPWQSQERISTRETPDLQEQRARLFQHLCPSWARSRKGWGGRGRGNLPPSSALCSGAVAWLSLQPGLWFSLYHSQ